MPLRKRRWEPLWHLQKNIHTWRRNRVKEKKSRLFWGWNFTVHLREEGATAVHVPHCLAPQTYVVSGIFDRETDNGWWMLLLWSLTLLKAFHKCKGCPAVLCTSLAADLLGSLKLLASCSSPGQQLPPKLEAISCLSAYLKSGTARRTPEGASTDPRSPSLFLTLDWGTGLHPCVGICSYVPAGVVLPVIGNCVCASDNCTKLAEFGVGERQDLPLRAAESQVFRSGDRILFLLRVERFPCL